MCGVFWSVLSVCGVFWSVLSVWCVCEVCEGVSVRCVSE